MKKRFILMQSLLAGLMLFSGCDSQPSSADENYLVVIGEYERQVPKAGYRLNLAYNGPISLQDKFQEWADSVQRVNPTMVKTSDNIYFNQMPEQLGRQRVSKDMFQANTTYNLIIPDSAAYNSLVKDAFSRDIPFNITVSGTHLASAERVALQQELMNKALENAKTKLKFLSSDTTRHFEIISIEELDTNVPYGPEYYDYNRKLVSRLKVKARML